MTVLGRVAEQQFPGGRPMGVMSDFEAMAFIVAVALMLAALALVAVG